MPKTYDVIVIGTGPAGAHVAARCRQAGRHTAIVDKRPLGGTCALRGCNPKKVLVNAADALHLCSNLAERGVVASPGASWQRLMAFKNEFTDPIPAARRRSYRDRGIDAYQAAARFTGPRRLDVGGATLEADQIVIATGARPRPLPFAGAEHVRTSDDFLSLAELPRRLAFVGAGYISMEFAHVASHFGAEVVLLERAARPLQGFDADLVARLVAAMRQRGIELQMDTNVEAVKAEQGGFQVCTDEGQSPCSQAGAVFHGAGRVPDLEELDLSCGEVQITDGRIQLNEVLQSVNNPAVYAAGDAAAAGPALTPVAHLHAETVTQHLLTGAALPPDYRGVPSVAFTLPPLARVGLAVEEAQAVDSACQVRYEDTPSSHDRRRGESCGAAKIILSGDGHRLLGAHLLGSGADEAINLLALVLRCGLAVEQLRAMPFAFPTAGFDLRSLL